MDGLLKQFSISVDAFVNYLYQYLVGLCFPATQTIIAIKIKKHKKKHSTQFTVTYSMQNAWKNGNC
jgi:hypothetical protein